MGDPACIALPVSIMSVCFFCLLGSFALVYLIIGFLLRVFRWLSLSDGQEHFSKADSFINVRCCCASESIFDYQLKYVC